MKGFIYDQDLRTVFQILRNAVKNNHQIQESTVTECRLLLTNLETMLTKGKGRGNKFRGACKHTNTLDPVVVIKQSIKLLSTISTRFRNGPEGAAYDATKKYLSKFFVKVITEKDVGKLDGDIVAVDDVEENHLMEINGINVEEEGDVSDVQSNEDTQNEDANIMEVESGSKIGSMGDADGEPDTQPGDEVFELDGANADADAEPEGDEDFELDGEPDTQSGDEVFELDGANADADFEPEGDEDFELEGANTMDCCVGTVIKRMYIIFSFSVYIYVNQIFNSQEQRIMSKQKFYI